MAEELVDAAVEKIVKDAIAEADVKDLDRIIDLALKRKEQLTQQVCVPTSISNFGVYLRLHEILPKGTDLIVTSVLTSSGRRFLPHGRLTHQLYLHNLESILEEYPDAREVEVYGLSSKGFVTVWNRDKKKQ